MTKKRAKPPRGIMAQGKQPSVKPIQNVLPRALTPAGQALEQYLLLVTQGKVPGMRSRQQVSMDGLPCNCAGLEEMARRGGAMPVRVLEQLQVRVELKVYQMHQGNLKARALAGVCPRCGIMLWVPGISSEPLTVAR